MHYHVISIFLNICESWTLTAELEENKVLGGEMVSEVIDYFLQGPITN